MQWFKGLSDDQKERFLAWRQEFQNDDTRAARLEERAKIFASADVNGDGFLDFEEFMDFNVKNHQSKVEQGVPSIDPSETPAEHMQGFYNVLKNEKNPENPGISLETWQDFGM